METKSLLLLLTASLCIYGGTVEAASKRPEAEEGPDVVLPGEVRTNDQWARRMQEALALYEASADPGEEKRRPLVTTGPIAKHIPAKLLEADVTGLKYVWLLSLDGGDGTGGDHQAWVEPVATKRDGTKVSGILLPVLAYESGWRELRVAVGKRKHLRPRQQREIKILDNVYTNGWWNHPKGAFCLALDGNFTKLAVKVGADRGAPDWGKQEFAIASSLSKRRVAWMLGDNLAHEFPEIDKWIADDLGVVSNGHVTLFMKQPRRLREMMTRYGSPDALDRLACKAKLTDLRRVLEFVEKKRPAQALAGRIKEMEKESAKQPCDYSTLLKRMEQLRREILFTHPALDFAHLLVNKQPTTRFTHQCDQYLARHNREGPGLVILRNWKSGKPEEIELLAGKLPKGSVAHPDLSFDGRKVAFAYADCTVDWRERRFLIWEINADGTGLRQLTGGAKDKMERWDGRETALIEDFDPCYLPDGGLAFISTRCQTFGRCHAGRYTPSYMLYRMNGDGTGIRQLSFGEANEWDPSVLPDGRIIYTRWDYINRNDVIFQSLWTMHPDGTGTAHYYGNYTRNPCMTAEARAIPGTDRVVSTAMAHHGLTAGSLIEIDTSKGEDGEEPITRLTPEVAFPETEEPKGAGAYQTPWPLGDGFYLAAYSGSETAAYDRHFKPNDFGIVLLDPLGGRTEIYRDEQVSTVSPIPLRARPRPPILASSLPKVAPQAPGRIVVQNANIGKEPFGEPIRAIRVNEIFGQPTAHVPHRSVVMQEIVKRAVGTAKVEPDGSIAFEIPSGRPLQLQALGTNGTAVMTMRSFVYAQPGETLACIGCHENKAQAPRTAAVPPHKVQKLRALRGQNPTGGFDYQATVQPVLNRHCVKCHGGDKPKADLDLCGQIVELKTPDYPGRPEAIHVPCSYNSLVTRNGLVARAKRNEENGWSTPRDYFAAAGQLAPKLLGGHCRSLLADKDGLECVLTWLDLNAQCFGDYSWSRTADGGDGRPPANGTCGRKPCVCGCCWVPESEKRFAEKRAESTGSGVQ